MHRANRVAVAAVVAVSVLAGVVIPAAAQSVTAFEGARLIVGDGRVIENATLVVDGTKIAHAGAAADLHVPPGATRVSLAGKTVMPMLIDTHSHLSATRDAIVRDLRSRAYYGVGAVLSLGTDTYEVLDMRGQTIPGGARFLSAGRGITMPEPGRTTVPYWVSSGAEGQKAVEELAAHKVDLVKIWVDTRDGKYKKLTPEIYGAIIDEAHKRGLRVTAHISLAKLNAAGVHITLGTDGNRPWGPHEEMQDMVLAGMTPMEVLVAATRNSAEFLRIVDAGTLEAGKSADFIVLDANPLDDITNTRRISAVVLRGAAVDRAQPVR
jgi:cytosine/adenosine deaminase-related metal-dependent hydrolase